MLSMLRRACRAWKRFWVWWAAQAEADGTRKRAGIVVPGASNAGLAPWSGQIGAIHGGRGRSRLNRAGRLGTIAACDLTNGESRNPFVDKHLRAMIANPITPNVGYSVGALIAYLQAQAGLSYF